MSNAPTSQGPEEPQAVQPGELKKPAEGNQSGKTLDLDFLLDIPLQIKVEVGRTRMMIQELLQLGKGSVVELDKLVGEPFEVLLNDKLVARGEVVVVNDHFGIRLTDIISPNERVKSLA
jgi:flagellar motor switch protein FliN/FliY